jgi:membrane-bound serine protease (ClpP class)
VSARARRASIFVLALIIGSLPGLASSQPAAAPSASILRCELEGTVDAGSAAYLSDCLEVAERDGHQALLLRLDTPGGALEATQRIVQAMMGAKVPVLVWVGPSGARAGSAGTFLVLASHLAGMAEATRIGAAHPVGITGGDIDQQGEHMAAKVENDAAAFAASIARARGRNAEWAEEAVRDSVSVPASAALELDVVEIVAPSEQAFLAAAQGREVMVGSQAVRLEIGSARLVELKPSLQQRLLHALASPALAYLLLLLGGLGIAIELTNPGMIVPGAIGVVAFLLAMMALATLPVRTGAVLLLVLGLGLIVAELFVSTGLAGATGAVLLVLGGLLLVERFEPGWFSDSPLAVPARIVVPTAVLAASASIFLLARVRQGQRLPPQLGAEALVGQEGRTLAPVDANDGEVFVHGERWRAISPRLIPPERRVRVRGFEGLTLHVEEIAS